MCPKEATALTTTICPRRVWIVNFNILSNFKWNGTRNEMSNYVLWLYL